jgi:hypothetical protein
MLLALKKTNPSNATRIQRLSAWVIKARLVSQYSHGGIVINGDLYHATAANGLHKLKAEKWTPEAWEIYDVGGDDTRALELFELYKGAAYAWLRILTFVGVPQLSDATKMYCFEVCYLLRWQKMSTERMTPEILLALSALRAYIKRA